MENGTTKDKLRISPSALSCWDDCKWKFKMSYIDRVQPPIRGNKYSCFGSAIHDSIAMFYKDGDLGDSLSILKTWPETFLNQISTKNVTLSEMEIEDFEELGRTCLISFYARQKGEGLLIKPFLSEKKFTRETERFIAVGIVDIAFGTVEDLDVLDFKTNSKAKTKSEVEKDRQLSMYAWFFWKETGVIPKRVGLHYIKLDKRVMSKRSESQLVQFETDLHEFCDKVQTEKEWIPNYAFCSWCEFRRICVKNKAMKIPLV